MRLFPAFSFGASLFWVVLAIGLPSTSTQGALMAAIAAGVNLMMGLLSLGSREEESRG